MLRFLPIILASSLCVSAFEEDPWIEYVYMPVGHLSAAYQHFNDIECHGHLYDYPGEDALIELGLYYTNSKKYDFQFDARITRSNAHPLGFDSFCETVRYAFLDDAEGDCIALMGGFALSEVVSIGLNDPSFIHAGHIEGELQIALGKEIAPGEEWIMRTWALGAMGLADRGSPWMRGIAAWEGQCFNTHYLQLRAESRAGFGGDAFRLRHFRGYGKIKYRILDGAVKYSYQTEDALLFSFVVLYRFFSRNAPAYLQQYRIALDIPFSF